MAKLSAPPILQPVKGTQISYSDWLQLVAYMESFSGMATALAQGVTNALPQQQPVTCVFSPTSLSVAVGGTDNSSGCQFALCQGILCASAGNPVGTQYDFTIPANSTGSTRIDAIAMQPATQQVSVVSRPVEQSDGSKPVQNVPVVINGLAIQYIEGPNGGGNPVIPNGWEKFAHIAVPNGATVLDDSALTLFFPYMNANAFTTSTAVINVPAEDATVIIPVNDTSVWQAGDFGYCVGPNSNNAFFFQVVSTDDNALTMTVTNLNTTEDGSGIVPAGAYILAAALAPVACTTAAITVPPLGSNVVIPISNSASFLPGNYGLVTGRTVGKSFYFYVTNNLGNSINVTNIGFAQGGHGLPGSFIQIGSTVIPATPPGIIEEDQQNGGILNPTMPLRVKKGVVLIPSAGGSVSVSFDTALPFSSGSSYTVSLGAGAANLQAYISAQNASGFTITLSGTGTGAVYWTAIGY